MIKQSFATQYTKYQIQAECGDSSVFRPFFQMSKSKEKRIISHISLSHFKVGSESLVRSTN